MTSVKESDLKRLENILASRFDELGQGISEIKERVTALENGQKTLEIGQTEIKGQIGIVDARLKNLENSAQKLPDLAEKVGELKNWKQIAIVLFTAFVSGAIAWFVRDGSVNP
jgi:archaellum component FlaC